MFTQHLKHVLNVSKLDWLRRNQTECRSLNIFQVNVFAKKKKKKRMFSQVRSLKFRVYQVSSFKVSFSAGSIALATETVQFLPK